MLHWGSPQRTDSCQKHKRLYNSDELGLKKTKTFENSADLLKKRKAV